MLTRRISCLYLVLALPAPFLSTAAAQDGPALLRRAGIKGGFVVHVGCGDGSLTARLRLGPQYKVEGIDTNPATVATARKRLLASGEYGPVLIATWDGRHLPYAENFVNLLVISDLAHATKREVLRVLTPRGVALVRRGSVWDKLVKPWPENMDQWTHYLHGPDGNPVGTDTLVGPPRRVQWLGLPRWARHHDHMASMTDMVSAAGRLFYILDMGSRSSIQLPAHWRLIARDAFNGTILWQRTIPKWNTKDYPLKSGPAHLLRRLVAVGDRVYVTLSIDAPVSVLDAATGKTLCTFPGTQHTREIVVSGDIALCVADKQDSRLPKFRRVATYVWTNTRVANHDWGWNGRKRIIFACDAVTGKLRWKREFPVAPCSLASDGSRVVFHDGNKLICLDRTTGKTLWEGPPAPVALPVPTSTGPRVLLYRNMVLFAGNNGKMSGWSARTGKKVWERKQKPSGHMSLRDLLVVEGLVWTADIANSNQPGTFTGYDPFTGEKKKEFPADVKLHWFHHRCYPSKATGKYVLTGRNGTEYVDLERQHWTPNHWVRGGCIYGVMPCNGMTYFGMDACGCQLEAKLAGLKALAPGPVPAPTAAELSSAARLERGPAYGRVTGAPATPADWPLYRCDEGRSGATSVTVADGGTAAWQTAKLGTHLTPPTIAAGKVFVADRDSCTLFALDAATGRKLWSYPTAGQTDTPPTYYRGLVLFGSADGHVYAVRATDGVLAWRFRAAPTGRRVMAWERIESAWPVHGSVLVHDGVLYCTAGRSIFLDGGIRFLRLDPLTGRLLGERLWDDKDPVSGKDIHEAYLKKTPGNTMPTALSDILTCDGSHLWMRSQKIDYTGNRSELTVLPATNQPAQDFHLFCEIGFVDDSYFFRSYWTYGRRTTGGYGGWYQAGRYVPSGRLLCFDDKSVYGYARKPEYMVNSSVVEYQLYGANKVVTRDDISRVSTASRRMSRRRPDRNADASDWKLRYFFPQEDLTATEFEWKFDQPSVFARALCVGGDRLYAAGPPDVVDERYAYHNPDDLNVQVLLKRQEEALTGKYGGQLWSVDKATGKVRARYALKAVPVFDGLAVAEGRLFLVTLDGRVLSWSAVGLDKLPGVKNQPAHTKWNKPEDPSYLLPPPEPKDSDFATVTGCRVFSAKLGYQIQAKGKNTIGIAVKKLDKPLTGTVTFTTTVRAARGGQGLLSNGYLAFGDGDTDAHLIKCGVRLRAQNVSLIQGPFKGGKSTSRPIDIPANQTVKIRVTVDLAARRITARLNKVALSAKLQQPLKAITYLGYAVDTALVDVAPITVEMK